MSSKGLTENFNWSCYRSHNLLGRDWLTRYLKRNPSVSVRKPEATSINRNTAIHRQEVTLFLKNLASVMLQHQFIPSKFFNVDKTGITTVQKPTTILAEKGLKRIGSVTSEERGRNVTLVCAMNASGTYSIYPQCLHSLGRE